MQRVGALLWPKFPCLQVYGANTDVGKTIVSTLLCHAWSKKRRTHYLKPISTGALEDADDSHISRFAKNVSARTLHQFSEPVSPHLAVGNPLNLLDEQLQRAVQDELASYAANGDGIGLVETAGGVLSPAPSGNLQADLYRPFRLPVLLVGDHRLGGIGTTLSAFESLHLRGYNISSIVLFEDKVYKNYDYIAEHFDLKVGINEKPRQVFSLPAPPERAASPERDAEAMQEYYDQVSESKSIQGILGLFDSQHRERLLNLESMAEQAHEKIWYPFTQHQGRTKKDIMVIDSAYGDDFSSLNSDITPESGTSSVLQPAMDASASWWTQGLGHGSPNLSLAAAYAAGRYGHVMFASAINEPAMKLVDALLEGHDNPRLAKVYFTDNGSTGMEVAIKMGLRAAVQRYGWDHLQNDIKILGFRGSYHGDTMGVMDASEPSVYNAKVEWYQPRGCWLDFPQVKLRKGTWYIEPPAGFEHVFGPPQTFSTLQELMDLDTRKDSPEYQLYIEGILNHLVKTKGNKLGALVMEPLILGAGGMFFVDPLFQRQLISTIRSNPSLINPSLPPTTTPISPSEKSWSGLPIIFDEVFTGLYRLGRFNTNSFLQTTPDVVVNAKLLTGGLIPLCTTIASQEIFEAFLSDEKAAALLHGHSYTAHPVGCNVAVESLKEFARMNDTESGYPKNWANFKEDWDPLPTGNSNPNSLPDPPYPWSTWSRSFVEELSHKESVDHCFALGSVLAIALKDAGGKGYESTTASTALQKKLLESKDGWRIFSRVLGNVIYFMASQTAQLEQVRQIEGRVLESLGK